MPITSPTAASETINGTAGVDLLGGLGGNDRIFGGAGNDVFVEDTYEWIAVFDLFFDIPGVSIGDTVDFGAGNDFYDGGSGDDALSYFSVSSAVTVNLNTGTARRGNQVDRFVNVEQFELSEFNDTVIGITSNTSLLLGGEGVDTLNLTSASAVVRIDLAITSSIVNNVTVGNDLSLIQTGFERFLGATNFHNNMQGSFLAQTFVGGSRGDILRGGGGDDRIFGLAGNDVLTSESGAAEIYGGTGDDRLVAGSPFGVFKLFGGLGNDTLIAEEGAGVVIGAGGNDTITLNGFAHVAYGQSGNDSFTVNGTLVNAFAGAGSDTLNVMQGDAFGGIGTDTLIVETLEGNARLYGNGGNDTFEFSANDTTSGTLRLFGGENFDTLRISATGSFSQGGFGDTILANGFERILMLDGSSDSTLALNGTNIRGQLTSSGSFTIDGDQNRLTFGNQSYTLTINGELNTAVFGNFDDVVNVTGTDNRIQMSGGADTLNFSQIRVAGFTEASGGFGADTFVFANIAANTEVQITDFVVGVDQLTIDGITSLTDLTSLTQTSAGASLVFDVDFSLGGISGTSEVTVILGSLQASALSDDIFG